LANNSSPGVFLRFQLKTPHSELNIFQQLSIDGKKIGYQSNDDHLNSRKKKNSGDNETRDMRPGVRPSVASSLKHGI